MRESSLDVVPREVLVKLAREHLGGLQDVHVAPEIPARKMRGARATHALYLADAEPIVAVFDGTVLGGAEEGFVVTPSQLCWKNLLEHPRSIRWDDLAGAPIERFARHIEIARGRVDVPWSAGASERVAAFLTAVCQHTRTAAVPYRTSARVREVEGFAEAIIDTSRRAFGELDWIHYRPAIPKKMEAAVRIVHAKRLAPTEELLVVYDDTLFGSGNDGLLFTVRGVFWRSFWGAAEMLAWGEIDVERVASDGQLLLLGERREIDLRMRPGMASIVARVVREIVRLARSGG